MTNIYEEKDYDNALKLKKKLLTIYFIVLGVVFAIAVFLYLKFFFLPYESNLEVKRERLLYQVLMIFLFSLFAIFSFIYLGIPYKRARRYFIFLDDGCRKFFIIEISRTVHHHRGLLQRHGHCSRGAR